MSVLPDKAGRSPSLFDGQLVTYVTAGLISLLIVIIIVLLCYYRRRLRTMTGVSTNTPVQTMTTENNGRCVY